MRLLSTWLALGAFTAWVGAAPTADPGSDAPEHRPALAEPAMPVEWPLSYELALRTWRAAEDLNAWIGARFVYDMPRALLLSESQRALGGRVEIHAPGAFFADPSGVCVDLARFAVETLRAVDPASQPRYLMIEFDPALIAGHTLRRHWLASYRSDGQLYFFADSKRPGFVAGPYATVQDFIDEYARYRGRRVVSYRDLASYERQTRKQAPGSLREQRP